ncbi:MAG TPA: gamma-glutamyl-gamma-aminobutyrate hydrolase family protein [Acidimicrobiia bacterium]
MTPLVGITAWRRELGTYLGRERLQTLSDYYSNAVIAAGITPIIFPNGQASESAGRLVGLVDGLILSGGDDVSPETYGETITNATGDDTTVDQFEIALVREARAQGKPVLAICRGLQLLNVALGGTLHQDVTGTPVHAPFEPVGDPEDMASRFHVVSLRPDSILAGLYKSQEIKTNTLHHQGVKDLSPELIVEGTTDDGLIEAARCEGSWWALGVQWHPERSSFEEREPLFSAFREALSPR